jgi:transcriptional regulator with XRE-family HTH domain
MGYARPKPERLADKLKQIRLALGLSQTEIHRRLGVEDLISNTHISRYESGLREPPLIILLQYARIAGINTEALIDDDVDLPEHLPSNVSQEKIKRAYPPHRKKR